MEDEELEQLSEAIRNLRSMAFLPNTGLINLIPAEMLEGASEEEKDFIKQRFDAIVLRISRIASAIDEIIMMMPEKEYEGTVSVTVVYEVEFNVQAVSEAEAISKAEGADYGQVIESGRECQDTINVLSVSDADIQDFTVEINS